MDISYELEFHHNKNYACMAKELREIVKILQYFNKTVMKIILRNDCENGHFTARMGLTLSSTARFL